MENDLIRIINKFDDLKNSGKDLNKYQEICFEAIKNDLNSMISFIKSFEYYKQCKGEGKICDGK